MRVTVYHPKAPAEARQFFEYYQEISPELAERFWAELVAAIDYATEFPERHHFDSTGLRRSDLEKFPVHFLFRVFNSHIRVTTIRHHRQNPRHGAGRG